MQRQTSMWLIGVVLLGASAVIYVASYLFFNDAKLVLSWLLLSLAFVPVEVLLVVIIVGRVLGERERRAMLTKLNMVIGAFFSELGTQLLGDLTPAVEGKEKVRAELAVTASWAARDFDRATAFALGFEYKMDSRLLDLYALRELLVAKREFMVRLLENPNLLEHQRFTNLMWAIFHLVEELTARPSLDNLPEHDLNHLSGDMHRAYSQLAGEWLAYVRHLQQSYPFLFSLVVRMHPMQDHPSAIIQ